MEQEKVRLKGVAHTLLGSLSARAVGGDLRALEACAFLKTHDNTMGNFSFEPAIDRTAIYDAAVLNYISAHPRSRILNIGCGFCTRFERVDNGQIHWTDFDQAEVVALRRQFFGPDSPRRRLVSGNLRDKAPLPTHDLLVAEGVLVYLPESRAMEIVQGHCLFDVFTMERTVRLGSTQLWRYDPSNWNLNVLNSWHYDSPSRQAMVLEVHQ